jgi:hypothetical protein
MERQAIHACPLAYICQVEEETQKGRVDDMQGRETRGKKHALTLELSPKTKLTVGPQLLVSRSDDPTVTKNQRPRSIYFKMDGPGLK